MKPINALWADALSRHLTSHHMTRAEFATLMGVSEAAVYKWLRGGTATLDNIALAARIFKVHPARMLGGASVNKGAIDVWYDALHKRKVA
jgi:transcriptional regulator with XRE-family HTH domain